MPHVDAPVPAALAEEPEATPSKFTTQVAACAAPDANIAGAASAIASSALCK
jgi:hypothetical protein